MRRFLAALRKLQWKLTFSYTLVTVGALLVAEILLVAAVILFLSSDILANLMVANIGSEVVPDVQTFLEQTPPDQRGLQEWLTGLQETQTQIRLDGSMETETALQLGNLRIEGAGQQLWVLDGQQRLLGQVPPPQTVVFHRPFDVDGVPGSAGVLAAARRGESSSERVNRVDLDHILAAVPVQSSENETLGTVLMLVQVPLVDADTLGPLLMVVLVTIIPLTLGAGTIGTIFGFLTSRSFSRRLQKMSHAADAWSRGDFAVVAEDRAGDEIGQLSRRLNRMSEQLQHLLAARQELATLEERNRLARDLHDSVKQQVFAVAMQVGAAQTLLDEDSAAARASLEAAAGLARQAQLELTGLIQELHPAALEGKGLADALRELAADWSLRTDIATNINIREERPLPLPVAEALFRVAQEALANVARHSGAKTAVLQLSVDADTVMLTIQDDGQGFMPQHQRVTGVGLRGMDERMAQIDGELVVTSAPGGTMIRAIVGRGT